MNSEKSVLSMLKLGIERKNSLCSIVVVTIMHG